MESNVNPARDLIEAQRLAAATQREALKAPIWAMPLMTLAIVGFFVLIGKLDDGARIVASVAWTVFVLAWVYAIRRNNRAKPGRRAVTAEQRRRELAEWMVLLVIANVLTFALSRVSWALAGVALASLGAVYGSVSAWRARRS